ncbi:DUF2946 domain-containing protein [Dyella sp. 20L07]|uniref:DUF2946 domain-containing protein n=1 Tax=Dyella sp. 20L07 TaxID=3384240 RepID=UPI003D270D8B
MYRARAQRNAVAWLAILATCLLLIAPSISRVTATASMASSMGAMCGAQEQAGTRPSKDHHHTDVLDACAYCALVSHGTALGSAVVFSVPILPHAPAKVQLTGRSLATISVWRQPARGPPTRHTSALFPV